jgi:hypothetical protein
MPRLNPDYRGGHVTQVPEGQERFQYDPRPTPELDIPGEDSVAQGFRRWCVARANPARRRELIAMEVRHYHGHSDAAIARTLCVAVELVTEVRIELETHSA